jgi:hypothetical protein
MYLSRDPIGIEGGNALYAYVHDTNNRVDVLGLNAINGKGALGEYNAGISKIKNTNVKIDSSSSRCNYRLPDAINQSGTKIIEVKNTQKQGYTKQIKNDVVHVKKQASQNGGIPKVYLVVDNGATSGKPTSISRELQKQHNDPNSPIVIVSRDLNKPKKSCP